MIEVSTKEQHRKIHPVAKRLCAGNFSTQPFFSVLFVQRGRQKGHKNSSYPRIWQFSRFRLCIRRESRFGHAVSARGFPRDKARKAEKLRMKHRRAAPCSTSAFGALQPRAAEIVDGAHRGLGGRSASRAGARQLLRAARRAVQRNLRRRRARSERVDSSYYHSSQPS